MYNLDVNENAFDNIKAKKVLKKITSTVLAIGLGAIGGIIGYNKYLKKSTTPEVSKENTFIETPAPVEETKELNFTFEGTPAPVEETKEETVVEQFNSEAVAQEFHELLKSKTEGLKNQDKLLQTYSVEALTEMINYFNTQYIKDIDYGDGDIYLNMLDGLQNLECQINEVLPLYLFQPESTNGQALAKEIYEARKIMMEERKNQDSNQISEGVSKLGLSLYQSFVTKETTTAYDNLENPGAVLFNLSYGLSNQLVREVDDKMQSSFAGKNGEQITFNQIWESLNYGKELSNHDNKFKFEITNIDTNKTYQGTYIQSYYYYNEHEIIHIQHEEEAKEQEDISTFNDITNQDKLTIRNGLITTILTTATKDTQYADEIMNDFISTGLIDEMLNYFNSGSIENLQYNDGLKYITALYRLEAIETSLNKTLSLQLFLIDNTKEQAVTEEINNARKLIMDGKTSSNQEQISEGISTLGSILYETYVMPGWNNHIAVNHFESNGSKVFNLALLLSSNDLVTSYDQDGLTTFKDACERNITWNEVYTAVKEGNYLRGHEDRISITVSNEIYPYISGYCLDTEQEIIDKQINMERNRG